MKMKVLVAEDDELTRQGLVEILEGEGYATVTAGDGREALKAFEREGPDFVCLDVMMPGLDGYAVCREIRRRSARVPVIFISAKSEEIDTVLGLELGADDFIVKPFGVKEVVARIRAVTRRCLAAQADETSAAPFTIGDLEVLPAELRARRGDEVIDLGLRREAARALRTQRGESARPQHHLRCVLGDGLPAEQPHPRPAHLAAPQADRARAQAPRHHPHRARGGLPLRRLIHGAGREEENSGWAH